MHSVHYSFYNPPILNACVDLLVHTRSAHAGDTAVIQSTSGGYTFGGVETPLRRALVQVYVALA